MLCRSKERGIEAVDKIKAEVNDDNCDVHLHLCDVSEPKEIKQFVDDFSSNFKSLDVLVRYGGCCWFVCVFPVVFVIN